MKRICFVVGHPKYHIGGAEIQSHILAGKLVLRKYDVCYLNPICGDVEFNCKESIEGVTIYNYKARRRFKILDFLRIKRVLTRINADVYYLRACPFTEGFVNYVTMKYNRGKTIWQCSSGRCLLKFIKVKESIKNNNAFSVVANLIDNASFDILRWYAIKKSSVIVAQTQLNKSVLRVDFKRESVLIKKGVPVVEKRNRKDSNKVNILYLRNIGKSSRINIFIDIATKLEGVDKYEFTVIGRIKKGYKKGQKREILASLNRHNINYLGSLDHELVLRELGKAHILIDTLEEKREITTYSNAFLEAWSHGVIVLSFGSNPDNVFNNHNVGFFVKSEADCVKKIKDLTANSDVMNRMSSDAVRYALENHNIDTEVNQLAGVIGGLA